MKYPNAEAGQTDAQATRRKWLTISAIAQRAIA